jgi:amidase
MKWLFHTWVYDGGKDCRQQFKLSGEKVIPQVAGFYNYDAPNQRIMGADEVAETNIGLREYRKEYLDYWLSTAEQCGKEGGVDVVVMPVAPYAAARPQRYLYYGYSAIVNALDYTSVVVPVTECDKNVDEEEKDYKPMNEKDREAWESYDPDVYDGAHVSVQVVGRRLSEEKTLMIAEHIGGLLGNGNVSRQGSTQA